MAARIQWLRALLAAVVAYVVFVTAMTVLFGNPGTERILYTDQAGQSPKVLAMFFDIEPRPAVFWVWDDLGEIGARGAVVEAMLLVWALGLVLLYAYGWVNRPGPAWRRGLTFGVATWAVVFVLFEALIPFNVLWEPFRLVVVQLALEFIAMMLTGLTIALVYRAPTP